MSFQLVPKQERWLNQIEGKELNIKIKLKDITTTENYGKVASMRFNDHMTYAQIAIIIRKNPENFFTHSV